MRSGYGGVHCIKRGLLSLRPARYVIFGYEPHRDNRTAVARSTFGATFSHRLSAGIMPLYTVRDSISRIWSMLWTGFAGTAMGPCL